MITLMLEEKDRDLLRRVLEYYLSELRMEVAGTDRQEFRDKLKDEEETLKIILSRLG